MLSRIAIYLLLSLCFPISVYSSISIEDPISEFSVDLRSGRWHASHPLLTLRGPLPVSLALVNEEEGMGKLGNGWRVVYHSCVGDDASEHKSGGLKIQPEYDSYDRLLLLRVTSANGLKIYNYVKVNYFTDRVELESLDGQKAIIHYVSVRSQKIQQVISAIVPQITYEYDQDHIISQKQNDQILINEFEEDKIITQKLGDVVVARYEYHPDHTVVYNALDNKTVYRWNEEKQLDCVESYLDDALIRSEKYAWVKINDRYLLRSKRLSDSTGKIHSLEKYAYDAHGNCVKEELEGNLTGVEAGVPDIYITEYVYSDEHRLIKKIEGKGRTTLFQYLPGTDLLAGRCICEGDKICIRQSFLYNNDGLVERSIKDDGSSFDFNDNTGVTEKHIVTLTVNLLGMPDWIEEGVQDSAQSYSTVHTTINTYNEKGLLTQQEIADAKGTMRKSTLTHYDERGRVTFIEDSAGFLSAAFYDSANHLIWSFDGKEETEYTYTNGQLSKSSVLSKQGHKAVTEYTYDKIGNRLVENINGNQIVNTYDNLGRLVSTLYPQTLNEENVPMQAEVSFTYDAFDKMISSTNAKGYVTHFSYNARGKLTRIIYPDQTEEKYIYYPDGNLKIEIAKNGTRTEYTYDFLDRVVEKKIISPADELIRKTFASYNSFHKTAEVDEEGRMSVYDYNSEGQLSGSTLSLEGYEQKKTYAYDDYGTLRETKVWFGSEDKNYTSIITERDVNDQVVNYQVKNHLGKTLISTSPPRTSEKSISVHYNTDFTNELDQKVLQVTEIDEAGISTIRTFDAVNREVSLMMKDSFGQVLSETIKRYDLSGNLVLQKEQNFTLSWTYDSMNRIEKRTESSEGIQKTYLYTYSVSGAIETITKPDGVILVYEYDALGHLTALFSSDSSISYRYTYDACGHLSTIKDLVSKKDVKRTVNGFGKIVEESFGPNLTVHNAYDLQGRRTRFTLFDGSSLLYEYDAAFLKGIKRLSKDHKEIYAHEYQAYDTNGKLISSKLIGQLGNIMYSWDGQGRQNGIATNYWFESIVDYNEKNQPLKIMTTNNYSQEELVASYDGKGQLLSETGLHENTYAYDQLYNRIEKNNSPYSVNGINQLTTADDVEYTYDQNGNLIEKMGSDSRAQYRYDALDRLTELTVNSDTLIRYTYDGLHRRLSKEISLWNTQKGSWDPGELFYFVYDGDKEIGMCDVNGVLLEFRALGIGLGAELGASVAIEIGEDIYAPIHDYRGSVRCLVNMKTQLATEYYEYSSFGEERIYDNTGARLEKSINPWRFSSKRFDDESGFIFYGKRYYDPQIGRWTTPDPLGYVDNVNIYSFVNNDPLSQSDLYGLFSFSTVKDTVVTVWNDIYDALTKQVDNIVHYDADRSIMDLEIMGKQALGQTIFTISGYYSEHPFGGVYGHGELHEKKRITFINGILNDKVFLETTLELLSKSHGGSNIHYTYRASQGWTIDFLSCVFIKLGFVSSDSRRLALTWKKLIEEMGGPGQGGVIIHYAHSIGGTETSVARTFLSPEEQQMIHVITFGSATLVPDEGFRSVINVVSWRDGVCYVDPWHYALALMGWQKNVIFVEAKGDTWPMCDHIFNDYWDRWLSYHIEDFYKEIIYTSS